MYVAHGMRQTLWICFADFYVCYGHMPCNGQKKLVLTMLKAYISDAMLTSPRQDNMAFLISLS